MASFEKWAHFANRRTRFVSRRPLRVCYRRDGAAESTAFGQGRAARPLCRGRALQIARAACAAKLKDTIPYFTLPFFNQMIEL